MLQIADYPGMLIWRTVAMIINEALDALQKGVASEQDIDTAMRLGVNYPYGPLAWSATWLAANIKALGKSTTSLWRRTLSPMFIAAPTSASGERL